MQRIGIFPGVFDPIHNGHIAFAAAAQKAADLDAVYIIPESNPWHKTNVTPLRHRMAMVRLMIADQPALQSLRLGIDRFTVSAMLSELNRHFKNSELYLLVGSDVALNSLSTWQNVNQLLDETQLIIGLRSDDLPIASQLQQIYNTATIVTTNASDDRSSLIRQTIHPHRDIATYITNNQLYTTSQV